MAADIQLNAPDHNAINLGNFTTESETNVAISGSSIVVGYNSSKQAGLLGSGAWNSLSGYAFSTDGGATFTDGTFVPGGTNKLMGDPALAFDRTGSTVYYVSIGTDAGGISRIFVSPSTSTNPVTFGSPVIVSGLLSGFSPFQDKEFIAVDTTNGSFDGRVYIAWSEFSGGPNAQVLVAASSSTTPLTFSPTIGLSPTTGLNHGAMPAVAPNGNVYVVWGVFTSTTAAAPQTIQIVRSTDGGASFLNPDPTDPAPSKMVASVTSTVGNMVSGGINIRTRGFPYIAIDRTPLGSSTRGNIYVVFQATPPAPSTARSEIFFTRSTDRGKTWSAPRSISSGSAVTLNGDPTQNDNWMPSIAISPVTGHIRVTFYSRREDAANTNIRVYDAGSTDGGMTWFNQPRSDVAFKPSTGYDPLIVSTYMGDYLSLIASGSNYHSAWGDTRNTCAPPPGATSPCSPAGRGDQDAFYQADPDPTGPDLAITPWGAVTGVGSLWQSPDIFVRDAANNVVNAQQGIVNRLRGIVRNLGNAAADGVTVRFRYAPIFVGLTDSAFKQIAAPTVNFAAAGDPAGDDRKEVPAQWDLTDPTENNGGAWPLGIGQFEHFCVRVAAEFAGDINQSNNNAQTNFVDVSASCCRPFRFLIGNPFDRDIRARMVVAPLPKGYSVRLRGIEQGQVLSLRPKEIRVATLELARPPGFEYERRTQDVVASVSMQVGEQLVGGASVRLARANIDVKPPRDVRHRPLIAQAPTGPAPTPEVAPNTAVTLELPAGSDIVVRAIVGALREQQIPIAQVDEERGLVSSGPVPLNAGQMREAVLAALFKDLKEATGRYYVSFKVEKAADQSSQLVVSVRIILEKAQVDSPIGGRVVPSNGSLEKQHAERIVRAVRR